MAAPRPTSDPTRAALATVALVVLGLAAAAVASERIAPVYPEVRVREALLDRTAARFDAASFGNSHARAIDFETLGVDGFEFALGGSDFFETVRLVQHARRRLPNLREVYVLVAPIQIANSALPERWGRRRSVYLQTGDYRPMSGDWRLAATSLLAPLVRDDHWAAVFEGGNEAPPIGPDGTWRDAHRGEVRAPALIARHGADRAVAHQREAARSETAYPGLCTELGERVRRLVESTVGLRLVLFTPPYPRTYTAGLAALPPVCDVRPLAASLAARHPHVLYVDASTSLIAADPGLFLNGDHVNDAGAIAFSTLLRERVAAAGWR